MTPSSPKTRKRRQLWLGAALILVLGIGAGEWLGWPFLAKPMQRWLSTALDRRVSFEPEADGPASLRIRFIGGIHAWASYMFVASPQWSKAPYMMLARDADVQIRYIDLFNAYRGSSLRIRQVKATSLDGTLERLADGRASWTFGNKVPDPSAPATPPPQVDLLQVGAGTVTYRDALIQLDLDTHFSLTDGSLPAAPDLAASRPVAAASSAAGASQAAGLQLAATGTYRKNLAVKINAKTSGVLPLVGEGAASFALPITLDAVVGGARAKFEGTATDALHLGQLRGRFDVSGPSLAAVGDPLGVTLPTTSAFRMHGLILKEGQLWNAVFEQATVGSSELSGAFTFDAGRAKPLLRGRLDATRLLLADLGPAVGTPSRRAGPPAAAASSPAAKRAPGAKVLPDRPFDLPALRAMDANVLIDVADLDLGSGILQPFRPLRTHLLLSNGVLTLKDIDARTAQGRFGGMLKLDGSNAQALWNADLHWNGVRLENWVTQTRNQGAPPYVSGRLNGRATLAGQGKSTAAILGSLDGGVRMYLADGTLSHLAVEAAGIDIAQAIGVFIKGDESLPIQCSVADFVANKGQFRPRVLVVDTPVTTLWVDGSLSLASEALDLRLVAEPKNFSPVALRTPIRVGGYFSDPDITLEKSPLIARAAAATLLALVNPLAAVIPLIDPGDSDDAKKADMRCKALAARTVGTAPTSPEQAAAVSARVERSAARR